MIKSLEQIAKERNFDARQFGNKSVALAQFLIDIDEQRFRCEKPYGFAVDTEVVEAASLRQAFEDLADRIDTQIDGRKVGVIYCRSSGYNELPGANERL